MKTKCCSWLLHSYFPELKCLFKLAWPIILMNVFRYFNPNISVIMCGHLRKVEFDASSLANSLISIFGVSIDLGFSTACDTLFAQVYGSRCRRKLGLMLQRAILVMTIIYLLLACLHLNIEPFLIFISQDVEISRLASKYVALYLPGLFFDFHFLAISRYLQNQNIVYPMMISAGIGCVYNAIAQYIAIYILNFGIEASAIIQGSTCFIMFIIQLTYILISKVYKSTWQGIEFKNALLEWGSLFKLGIPGIIMIGVEMWTFQITTFVAGTINDVQLGAQTVASQTEIISYVVHTGLAIAVSIRAGQHLGANKPIEASLSARAVLITDLMISITTFTLIFSLRKYIPYIFTNDGEIRLMAEKILVLVSATQLVDSGCSSASAIFRACGKQFQGAVVMLMSYYFIGVPLGMVLVYVFKTDIRGFWLSLLIGFTIEVLLYLILIYRIDWNVEAEKAQIRVKENLLSDTKFDQFTDIDDSEQMTLLEHEVHIENYQTKVAETSYQTSSKSISEHLNLKNNAMLELSQDKLTRTIVIKRIILCSVTFMLIVASILLKIYLPRGYYIPCIKNNSSNLPLNKHYPFCNDTMFDF